VRPKFPHALISSIVTDPTEKDTTVPSRIEEIEKDMDDLRRRVQDAERKEVSGDTEMWIRGWRKCDSTWTAQPMGVCL